MPSAPANAQCVVATQPSSRPACAAMNAPVHTLTTRRVVLGGDLIQPIVSGSAPRIVDSARRRAAPGCRWVRRGSGSGWATSARPVPVAAGSPFRDDDADGVALVGAALAGQPQRRAGEHLERADQVESLDAREAEDHHRSHVSQCWRPDAWRLCHAPHKLGHRAVSRPRPGRSTTADDPAPRPAPASRAGSGVTGATGR